MLPTSLLLLLAACLQHPPASASTSFLTDALVKENQVQQVLEHQPAKDTTCRRDTTLTGPIETTLCDYETVESVNEELFTNLSELVKTPFFKYFRVDLYRDCPFWEENGFCMNRECGITTVDESEIPEKWRAAALSKVELPSSEQRQSLPGCYYRDSDYCFLDDMTEGDYIDLSVNPERFTGYIGPSAHRIWSTIYQENCFGMKDAQDAPGMLFAASRHAKTMYRDLVGVGDGLAPATQDGQQCLEKRVYYKVISGLHASISTHICAEYFNQTTGEWGPNLACFINRVAAHPERLQYIYFNTVLMLRAVSRLGPYLSAYDYCSSGTHEDDKRTLDVVGRVVGLAREAGRFDESVLFRGEDANVLKEEFKQHFRNVSRIMDCVGCDKCRLWGKVQTTGVATALKILFELDEKALDPRSNANLLQRSEVVALINTLYRFSESLYVVGRFREMWAAADGEGGERILKEAEQPDTARNPKVSPVAGRASKDAEYFYVRIIEWIGACRRGTVGCVSAVVEGVRWVWGACSAVFRVSGKERGPGRVEF
ncbi:endoplasmic oxidoreductin [Neolentinus lepideus HHB14362 ss-1]|uniref:Endoplasmic oxidoreductin n=1 Tax=Neolentinus lepideus HHB14362 ss-1 TaxID=1314782 RepID=A0A165TI59_9AGAM|nr:endoplasmic oxidoreductin [Neolentinus lepideus HHB14362 ss-1]